MRTRIILIEVSEELYKETKVICAKEGITLKNHVTKSLLKENERHRILTGSPSEQ